MNASRTMRRYLIYGPPYSHRSGGLVALYNLQRALIQHGQDCIYFSWNDTEHAVLELDPDDIVVYPEIIIGNPLAAPRVVRWLLNVPGVCGGDGVYAETDLVYAYAERYRTPATRGLLYLPVVPPGLRDEGLPRTHDCIWYHKGRAPRIPLEGLEITSAWPRHRSELFRLLQTCRTLYSYDDNTALLDEAFFSGCQVKLVLEDGTLRDWQFDSMFYTREQETEQQLQAFIQETQEMA